MNSVELYNYFSSLIHQQGLFESFIQNRHMFFIIGVLTLSIGIIGRNRLALIGQSLLFISMWFQFYIISRFFPLLLINDWFLWIHYILYFVMNVLQVSSFVIVLAELCKWIKKETLENSRV